MLPFVEEIPLCLIHPVHPREAAQVSANGRTLSSAGGLALRGVRWEAFHRIPTCSFGFCTTCIEYHLFKKIGFLKTLV